MTDLQIINYFVFLNIIACFLAGILIVSTKKSFRIFGMIFYFLTNLISLNAFLLVGLSSFLISFMVFISLNILNMFRVIKETI